MNSDHIIGFLLGCVATFFVFLIWGTYLEIVN